MGIDAVNAKYWNEVAATWSRKKTFTLWRTHCDEVIANLLKSELRFERAGRLLKTDLFDEAFGSGLYSALSARTDKSVGMDIAINTVRQVRIKYPGMRSLNADVRNLPFQDDCIDVIVSNSTLDHFPNRKSIVVSLKEFFRVLRPGGTLVLTLDNNLNPFVTFRAWLTFPVLYRLGIVPYYFGRSFGPVKLKDALRVCGFHFGDVFAFMHCPRFPAVVLSRWLTKYGTAAMQRRFLRLLMFVENSVFYPLSMATGHFLAVRAAKPQKKIGLNGDRKVRSQRLEN